MSTLPACRRVRRQEVRHYCSNSTTADVARTPRDPPAHPPNDPQITTAQQDVRRQYLIWLMQRGVGLLYRTGGHPVVTTPCHIGDPIPLLSTLRDGRDCRWGPFFNRWDVVCGEGVARSRGRGLSRGARESSSRKGHEPSHGRGVAFFS